jgi:hypothetical protein
VPAGQHDERMPRPPHPLPPSLGDTFTCGDARRDGVSRSRLRAADLERPFRGGRQRLAEASGEEGPLAIDRAQRRRVQRLARAYEPLMPPHAFFVGRTAAVLLGGPVAHGADLDVGVLAPARPPRRRGVVGRKLAPALVSLREVDGLRVSSVASTWAMLAGELSVRELVRLGDAFVTIPRDDRGRHRPEARLATPEQLRAAARAGRRQGAARLREALELIRVGAMSPLETDWRLDATAAGMPEPRLDAEIRDRWGRLLGIADAAFDAPRVLVEVEGDHHRVDPRQWARDIEKHAAFTAAGWEVVRLTAAHIRGRQPRAVAILREALQRRGWGIGA